MKRLFWRCLVAVWVVGVSFGCAEPCADLAQLCETCPTSTERQKVIQVECRTTVRIGSKDNCSTAVVLYQSLCNATQ